MSEVTLTPFLNFMIIRYSLKDVLAELETTVWFIIWYQTAFLPMFHILVFHNAEIQTLKRKRCWIFCSQDGHRTHISICKYKIQQQCVDWTYTGHKFTLALAVIFITHLILFMMGIVICHFRDLAVALVFSTKVFHTFNKLSFLCLSPWNSVSVFAFGFLSSAQKHT